MSLRDDARKLYDGSAESYAAMMDGEIEEPIYDRTLGRLAKRLSGISGPVVDLACGSGHMLGLYHRRFDPERELIGVDLSAAMAKVAESRFGDAAAFVVGDMADLRTTIGTDRRVAGIINFFSIHHLDETGVREALTAWYAALVPGGVLMLAAWEGTGPIDYGDEFAVKAYQHPAGELTAWLEAAGFAIERCEVTRVDEMEMDAVYVDAAR